tara:strand:- start:32392 stop:32676 length:285 start_codon:yes stop_codon:yes gene_type:complete
MDYSQELLDHLDRYSELITHLLEDLQEVDEHFADTLSGVLPKDYGISYSVERELRKTLVLLPPVVQALVDSSSVWYVVKEEAERLAKAKKEVEE